MCSRGSRYSWKTSWFLGGGLVSDPAAARVLRRVPAMIAHPGAEYKWASPSVTRSVPLLWYCGREHRGAARKVDLFDKPPENHKIFWGFAIRLQNRFLLKSLFKASYDCRSPLYILTPRVKFCFSIRINIFQMREKVGFI